MNPPDDPVSSSFGTHPGEEEQSPQDPGLHGAEIPVTSGPLSAEPPGSPSLEVEPQVPKPLTLHIDLTYGDRVNYAMHQNGVEVIKRLSVTSDVELHDVAITVALENGAADERTLRLDRLPATSTFNIESLSPDLIPHILENKIERERTRLLVSVAARGFSPLVKSWPLIILAHNEWPGTRVLPEILAAFVLPNDPSVVDLMARARKRLMALTGDGSISGYQLDQPEHIVRVAQALYDTIQGDHLGYLGVPPSFEEEGQKVRLPEQIYTHRQGNCLDLSCLFAAAFEGAGVHPIIVLLQNHAFVGVWTLDDCFAYPVIDDVALLIKRVELGHLLVLEATAVTAGEGFSMRQAMEAALRRLKEMDSFRLAIDVKASRKLRIRALQIGGTATEPRRAPMPSSAGAHATWGDELPRLPRVETKGQGTNTRSDRGHSRVDVWKGKLLDLSLRNRFLNYRPSSSTVEFLGADLDGLEQRVAEGKSFSIHPRPEILDSQVRSLKTVERQTGEDALAGFLQDLLDRGVLASDHPEEKLTKILTGIYRKAKENVEESGANSLFLALGFLHWYETDTSEGVRKAPIVLVPAELKRPRVGGPFTLVASLEDVRVNITLMEKLRRDFRLETSTLGDIQEETSESSSSLRVATILQRWRAAIVNQRRWLIKNEAALANLSFNKVTMWEDLENHAEKLEESEVVSHLVNQAGAAFSASDLPRAEDLDRDFKVEECLCPLDADSSQLAAVLASRQGRSFVLKGPPGTGKSQTITNMIAMAIAGGQRVLFVAEKRAALEVVQSRLARVGLERFCLEVHSNKANKRDVLLQLGKVLDGTGPDSPLEWSETSERVAELRDELNAYAEAIHERHALGLSVFMATSSLIGLRNARRYRVARSRVAAMNAAEFRSVLDRANQLVVAFGEVGSPEEHPLRAVRCADFTPRLLADTSDEIDDLLTQGEAAESDWRALALLVDGPAELPRGGVEQVLKIFHLAKQGPTLPRGLLEAPDVATLTQQISKLIATKGEYDRRRTALLADVREEILDIDPLPLLAAIGEAERAWFLPRLLKTRRLRNELRKYRLPTGDQEEDLTAWAVTLEEVRHVRTLSRELRESHGDARSALAHHWNEGRAPESHLAALLSGAEKARTLLQTLPGSWRNGPARQRLIALLCEDRDQVVVAGSLAKAVAASSDSLRRFTDRLRSLEKLLSLRPDLAYGAPQEASLGDVQKYAHLLRSERHRLSIWCHWQRSQGQVSADGFETLVNDLKQGLLPPEHVVDAVRRSVLEEWLSLAIEQSPALRTFMSVDHRRKIQMFADLDRRLISLAGPEVAARASQRIPSAVRTPSQSSEMGILLRQLGKKRGHMSLRKLFDELPVLLPRLKPCLLMSPLSVAQYLNPDRIQVDLVIFDEASQIPVWDAIGALGRGRAAIVVGDPKQLPPTTFFSRGSSDDDEDAESEDTRVEELESILDECIAVRLPERSLLWHYRSRHESLIAFSNYHYYDNRLLTFPAALERRDGLGVSLRYLKVGIYDRGKSSTNHAEALAIVAEIVRRCRRAGEAKETLSLGVVAFSVKQQGLIQDLLDVQRAQAPELEDFFTGAVPEPIFIKNLENVQGDERDVILFSICYGRDIHGKCGLNFGPINQSGGERRLNVAITRARSEVLVFSSIKHDAIDLARTNSVGLRHLKTFLDYADRGSRAIAEATTLKSGDDFESPFEEAVCQALRTRGYLVDSQVGCSGYRIDLAVKFPEQLGRYVLGVECDGAAYHSAASARDRDRLRQSVLESMGWTIHRIWSTDWWQDPQREMERLTKVLLDIRARDEIGVPAVPSATEDPPKEDGEANPAQPKRDLETLIHDALRNVGTAPSTKERDPRPMEAVSERATPSFGSAAIVRQGRSRPYPITAPPILIGGMEEFYSAHQRSQLRALLVDLVERESPVARDRAFRWVAESFGLSRLTSRAVHHLESLLNPERITVRGDFLWYRDQDPAALDTYRVASGGSGSPRTLDEIAPEEIAVAALEVLEASVAMPREALLLDTARVFGVARMGTKVRSALDRGVAVLLDSGRAIEDAGTLRLSR
jgi:very-short-patch-repair endonuclease